MAKKQEGLEIFTTSVVNVAKGLSYTKERYTKLASGAKNMLDDAVSSGAPKKTIAEIFGIYYCSLAGLIRAGALCRRIMGRDGFPVIEVTSGEKTFSCRESVLFGILRDEASELIKPYEDIAESYVDASVSNESFINSVTEEEIEAYLESIMKKKKGSFFRSKDKKKAAVAARYASVIKKKGGSLEKAPDEPVPYFEAIPAPVPEVEDLKKEYEGIIDAINGGSDLNRMVLDLQAELMSISSQLDAANSAIAVMHAEANASGNNQAHPAASVQEDELRREMQARDEAFTVFKKQVDKERAEREKYVYKPQYDRYYNEVLPALIESINATRRRILLKSLCVAGCCTGIALSFIFIL